MSQVTGSGNSSRGLFLWPVFCAAQKNGIKGGGWQRRGAKNRTGVGLAGVRLADKFNAPGRAHSYNPGCERDAQRLPLHPAREERKGGTG